MRRGEKIVRSKMVRGGFKYHPLIHGSWWRRDMWPKGREGGKKYSAFMQTLTHKHSDLGLAKGWRKAEQDKRRARNPRQKIKFNSLEEMIAHEKKQEEETAKLTTFERKERDRQRMLAMKRYRMGAKFYNWHKAYNVKFYKSTKRKIKSAELGNVTYLDR